MAKTTEKLTLKLAQKVDGENIYWKSRTWDTNLPSYFVLANYPANESLVADDLTGMLTQNAVNKLSGGSVTIGNLFSKPVEKPREKELRTAFSSSSMDELVTAALKHDVIVVATGSLTDKSEITRYRLREFIERINDQEGAAKLKVLVAQNSKTPAHPLSSGARTSVVWQLETLAETGLYKTIVEQMANSKMRTDI